MANGNDDDAVLTRMGRDLSEWEKSYKNKVAETTDELDELKAALQRCDPEQDDNWNKLEAMSACRLAVSQGIAGSRAHHFFGSQSRRVPP